jgi:hypothetical protein
MWGNVAWSVIQRVEGQSASQWQLHRTQVLLDFAKSSSENCKTINDLLVFIKQFLSKLFRLSECTLHVVFADFTARLQLDGRSGHLPKFIEHNGVNGEFRGIVGEVVTSKKYITCSNMNHPRYDPIVDICQPDVFEDPSPSSSNKVNVDRRPSSLHTFPITDGSMISAVLQLG